MKVKYCPRCQMDLRGGHLEDCSYVVTDELDEIDWDEDFDDLEANDEAS